MSKTSKILSLVLLSLTFLISGCFSKSSEKNIDAIEIEIPAKYASKQLKEELNQAKDADEIYDLNIKKDGSIICLVSPEKLEDYKIDYSKYLQDYIENLLMSESNIDISNISYSKDFNEFIIYTANEELSPVEKNLAYKLMAKASFYQIFLENDPLTTELNINFLNYETNQVVDKLKYPEDTK